MYIRVRVIAGAKKEQVVVETPDHFTISVREKAERNMANTRVIEIIGTHFGTKKVRIINGHHSPVKLLSVGD
jgi:uncharacterized protein YggU (UPF0235/DUF167 family)